MPPSLGDFFSKEFKDDYLGKKISPKCILLIKIPEFTDVKYPKYTIIVCLSDCSNYIAAVCINTDKPFTNNCITLIQKEYTFLKYDSYVSCDFISEMNIKTLITFLKKYPENILGEITDFQHLQILQRLQSSKVISLKLKRKFNLV